MCESNSKIDYINICQSFISNLFLKKLNSNILSWQRRFIGGNGYLVIVRLERSGEEKTRVAVVATIGKDD